MRIVLVSLALSLAGIVPVMLPAHADDGSPAIRGRLLGERGSNTTAMVLVIPADAPQPIDLDVYRPAEGGDWLTSLATERVGPGLVRAAPKHDYAVTSLAAGTYLVGTTADFSPYGGVLPPTEIQVLIEGRPSSMYAFEVTLEPDSTLMVNFQLGNEYPDTPGRMVLCADTYDPKTLQYGIPDRVTHASIASVDDAIDTRMVVITIDDEGCAVFSNIPPGEYTATLVTERGFTLPAEFRIHGGEDGRSGIFLGPVIADGPIAPELPFTGSHGRSGPHSGPFFATVALIAIGIAAIASGSVCGRARTTASPSLPARR